MCFAGFECEAVLMDHLRDLNGGACGSRAVPTQLASHTELLSTLPAGVPVLNDYAPILRDGGVKPNARYSGLFSLTLANISPLLSFTHAGDLRVTPCELGGVGGGRCRFKRKEPGCSPALRRMWKG